jgi:hypothetical protein
VSFPLISNRGAHHLLIGMCYIDPLEGDCEERTRKTGFARFLELARRRRRRGGGARRSRDVPKAIRTGFVVQVDGEDDVGSGEEREEREERSGGKGGWKSGKRDRDASPDFRTPQTQRSMLSTFPTRLLAIPSLDPAGDGLWWVLEDDGSIVGGLRPAKEGRRGID